MSEASPALLEVSILRIPVRIWAQTQEHVDELLREFALIAAQERGHTQSRDVPARLLQLVEELTVQYGGLNTEQEDRLLAAAQANLEEIDLVYRLPPAAAQASRHLQDMLDEVDTYCRAGTHLLTLATPPALARFRRWYLDEFMRQLDGRPPTPYPMYRG